MRIEPAEPFDMRRVAMAMRQRDLNEFLALSPANSKAELADELALGYGGSGPMGVWLDDEPIAVGAVVMSRPNVGTLLFYATDDFHRIATGLTRWITRDLFPRYRAAGVHRIECVSIEGYEQTHRWIELLGLKREAELKRFGKNGETFHQFAWVKS